MRNLAVKVPEDLWPEFKARVQASYEANQCQEVCSGGRVCVERILSWLISGRDFALTQIPYSGGGRLRRPRILL